MWIPLSLKMCRLTGNIIEHRLLCLYKPSRTNFQKFRQTRILQRAMDDSLTTIRFITLKGHRTISFCGCCEMVGRQSIPRSLWRIQWCSCFRYANSHTLGFTKARAKSFKTAVSSPVVAWQRLPTADFPLNLGSRIIALPHLPASNSNSSQRLNCSSPLTNWLLTNQLTSLHCTQLNCTH
jgi:hypothetical protein